MSKKKSDRLTISISPYLKDWIEDYVEQQHKKYPSEEYYRSISSFITSTLKANLELFEEGKSLKDFQQETDHIVDEFLEDVTFRAYIQNYENNVEKSKYDLPDFESMVPLFIKFKSEFFDNESKSPEKDFVKSLQRLRKYVLSNKVTKSVTIEYRNNKFYITIDGKYPNIQFINNKGLIGICSILGLKLEDLIITELHSRFEFSKTNLFKNEELLSKERKKLYQENHKKLINLSHIVNDKNHHLWIKMAHLDNFIISFEDFDQGKGDLTKMVEEINKFSNSRTEIKLNILKLFEQINWISLEDTLQDLYYFSLRLNREEHPIETKILLDTLNRNGILAQEGNKFSFR